MILDAFGPDASALLMSGALGGFVRGMVVLRSKAVGGELALTVQAITPVAVDIVTSTVIGSTCALFFSQTAFSFIGPMLEQVNAGSVPKIVTSGFIAGMGGITIITTALDFVDARAKLKAKAGETP